MIFLSGRGWKLTALAGLLRDLETGAFTAQLSSLRLILVNGEMKPPGNTEAWEPLIENHVLF